MRNERELQKVAALVMAMTPSQQRALIFWLADRFLGLDLWGTPTRVDAVSDQPEGSGLTIRV